MNNYLSLQPTSFTVHSQSATPVYEELQDFILLKVLYGFRTLPNIAYR